MDQNSHHEGLKERGEGEGGQGVVQTSVSDDKSSPLVVLAVAFVARGTKGCPSGTLPRRGESSEVSVLPGAARLSRW